MSLVTTVRNIDGAISLADFLISPKGKMLLGQWPVKTEVQGDVSSIPPGLRSMIQ